MVNGTLFFESPCLTCSTPIFVYFTKSCSKDGGCFAYQYKVGQEMCGLLGNEDKSIFISSTRVLVYQKGFYFALRRGIISFVYRGCENWLQILNLQSSIIGNIITLHARTVAKVIFSSFPTSG